MRLCQSSIAGWVIAEPADAVAKRRPYSVGSSRASSSLSDPMICACQAIRLCSEIKPCQRTIPIYHRCTGDPPTQELAGDDRQRFRPDQNDDGITRHQIPNFVRPGDARREDPGAYEQHRLVRMADDVISDTSEHPACCARPPMSRHDDEIGGGFAEGFEQFILRRTATDVAQNGVPCPLQARAELVKVHTRVYECRLRRNLVNHGGALGAERLQRDRFDHPHQHQGGVMGSDAPGELQCGLGKSRSVQGNQNATEGRLLGRTFDRVSHQQHWNCRLLDETLGDAPENKPRDPTATVRGHDNRPGANLIREIVDHIRRRAYTNDCAGPQPLVDQALPDLIQVALGDVSIRVQGLIVDFGDRYPNSAEMIAEGLMTRRSVIGLC